MQPACQHDLGRQRARLPSKIGKHQLRHVLRQMRVPARATERGGINEIHVSRDELSEGGFGAVVGVAPQELVIIEHRALPIIQPPNMKTGQESATAFNFLFGVVPPACPASMNNFAQTAIPEHSFTSMASNTTIWDW